MLHYQLILWHLAKKNPISDTKNFKQNLVNLVNEYKYQLSIKEKHKTLINSTILTLTFIFNQIN